MMLMNLLKNIQKDNNIKTILKNELKIKEEL